MWSHFAPWQGNGVAAPPASGVVALSDGKGGFRGDATFAFNTTTKELDVASLLVSSATPSVVINDTDGVGGAADLVIQAGSDSITLALSAGASSIETAGGTLTLGTTDNHGIDVLLNNAVAISLDAAGDIDMLGLGSFIQMVEGTDAAAPAANHVRIYTRDNGGKTELVARFNTGAIQQIAIEP